MFYRFQPMDEAKKVDFAAMHFKGMAEIWYEAYVLDNPNPLWSVFLEDVLARFNPNDN